MTDRSITQRRTGNDGSNLLDIIGNDVRANSNVRASLNTLRRVTVEILAANRYTDDEITELGTVGRDGALESRDFDSEGRVSP
jgi:hypothetical protein